MIHDADTFTLSTRIVTSTSRSDPVAASSSKYSSSVGIIVGVAVAAVVSITGAALALLWWKRRRTQAQNNKPNNGQEPLTQSSMCIRCHHYSCHRHRKNGKECGTVRIFPVRILSNDQIVDRKIDYQVVSSNLSPIVPAIT